MDLSTIIGIVLGFALIVWGIKIPQLPNFWDPQSLALTLGGTVAAVVASFPLSQLKRMGSHFKILVQGIDENIIGQPVVRGEGIVIIAFTHGADIFTGELCG